MQGVPLISLVLATVGRCDELRPLLRSLQLQTEPRFELIVVDQNADDRLLPLLQAARDSGLSVQHLRLAERNLSLARNHGLQAAQAPVVAFPDDDAWYEADTVQQALAQLAAHADDDGVIAWWVDVQAQGSTSLGLANRAEWRRFRGGLASSITLFLRTDALRRWGGFDPRLGVGRWYGAGEETDLVLHALAQGARLRHVATVRVRHPQPSHQQPWGHTLRRARGTGALYVKHRLPVSVVLRGLLAPGWAALRGQLSPGQAMAVTLGRAQGWLGWWAGVAR